MDTLINLGIDSIEFFYQHGALVIGAVMGAAIALWKITRDRPGRGGRRDHS